MIKPFPDWAKAEIARLRAEGDESKAKSDAAYQDAEAVERMLRRYLAQANGGAPAPGKVERYRPKKGLFKPGLRLGSKSSKIVQWVKDDPNGKTLQEVYRYVEEAKIGIATSATRSILWHAKHRGYLRMRGDRYVAPVLAQTESNELESPSEAASVN